jgi:hypothetical protein
MVVPSLAGYPDWLVAACAGVVAIAALWVVLKLLKLALWLLFYFIVAAVIVSVFVYFFG